MIERFAQRGLPYDPPSIIPNTILPLRLTELARAYDLGEPFHDRLMEAYWEQQTNIGDPQELRRLAGEVGLPGEQVEQTIADEDAYRRQVLESTRQAQAMGINGIPAFVLDERLLIMGANPIEVFAEAFAQLESKDEPRP